MLMFFTSIGQEATPKLNNVRPEKEDLLLLDFNWATLLNKGDSLSVKAPSWGFNLKLMYELPMQQSNFSFAFGGGIGVTNFYTNSQVTTFYEGTDSTQSFFIPIHDSVSYKRNKFSTTYGDIPIELRFRSNPDKKGYSLKIAAGVTIGYHFQSHSKIIQDSKKFKSYDFPNYEKWRYGVNFRVGYGKVALSSYYSLTSIFEEDKGEIINPFSIGITLMPF